MQLRNILVCAGLFSGSLATLTSQDYVDNIKNITEDSSNLRPTVEGLNQFNVITNAPKVINAFKDIIAQANDLISESPSMCGRSRKAHRSSRTTQGGPPFEDSDEAQPICDSFREFVIIHQQLLGVVIGKRTIFSNTPVLAPMTAVLRTLEGVVDSYAFAIIDAVPPCADDAQSDRSKIDKTLSSTVQTYERPALPRERMPTEFRGFRHDEQVNINIELA